MMTAVDLANLVAAYRVGECPGVILADALEENPEVGEWLDRPTIRWSTLYFGKRENWLIEICQNPTARRWYAYFAMGGIPNGNGWDNGPFWSCKASEIDFTRNWDDIKRRATLRMLELLRQR